MPDPGINCHPLELTERQRRWMWARRPERRARSWGQRATAAAMVAMSTALAACLVHATFRVIVKVTDDKSQKRLASPLASMMMASTSLHPSLSHRRHRSNRPYRRLRGQDRAPMTEIANSAAASCLCVGSNSATSLSARLQVWRRWMRKPLMIALSVGLILADAVSGIAWARPATPFDTRPGVTAEHQDWVFVRRVGGGGGGRAQVRHRPHHRPSHPTHRPGASRPGHRPSHPIHRPPGQRPPAHRPPGHRPPGYRPPAHRPPGYRPPAHRPPGYGGGWRPGYRPPSYWWRPGGAIAAGAAIGFVGAATAAAWAGSPPYAGMCWYYTDASRRHGFWDQCP
jgi:hypothetical protein